MKRDIIFKSLVLFLFQFFGCRYPVTAPKVEIKIKPIDGDLSDGSDVILTESFIRIRSSVSTTSESYSLLWIDSQGVVPKAV